MILVVIQLIIALSAAQFTTEPPPGCGIEHYKKFIILPEWQELFTVATKLSKLYQNPLCSSSEELFNTSRMYLEKLSDLDKAFDDSKFRSLDAVWELYLCGGPPHIKQIPYDKFVNLYNWTATELDNYYSIIEKTKRIYGFLVEELGILYDSEIVI